MTDALDATQRTRLERLVARARGLLDADLADRAAGRFGIDSDGTIAAKDDLHLDPTALAARRELVDVVSHLRSEGDDSPAAVARLLREAVFTHLNRLVAIRIAEALGLLPPSLADGRRSQGFRDLLELAPLLAGDDAGGYWTYLQLCGDELAGDVPTLFDPRNPLLALTPSPGALDDLVELLADPAAAELWTAPDCLGWVYQFFNTSEERRAMREESAAPRDSRELAVRNQFFTPRYVVDFLVQNSLGRRLMDADPASPLLDDLPLLIDPPAEQGDPVSLDEVSVLDPACGSGHFLLAAYDVLERAWHNAGVGAAEAAPSIVRSLWGIDIDPRCSQVAAAALIFRARRSCPEGELPRPNIVCARALPSTSTGLDELLAALPDNQRRLVQHFTEALTDAPILGSLLKIEERLANEVRAAAFGGAAPPGTLVDALPNETLQALEDELLTSLRAVADATTASPAERLLAAEADDAIRFVHALQRRYDTVLMNPPFGLAVEAAEPHLKAAYPDTWTEMYAAFIERSLALCSSAGYSALRAVDLHLGADSEAAEVAVRREAVANRPTQWQAALVGAAEQQLGRSEHARSEKHFRRAHAHLSVVGHPVPVGDLVATLDGANAGHLGELAQLDQARELRVGQHLAPQRLIEGVPRLRQAAKQAASLPLAIGVGLIRLACGRLRPVRRGRRPGRVVVDDRQVERLPRQLQPEFLFCLRRCRLQRQALVQVEVLVPLVQVRKIETEPGYRRALSHDLIRRATEMLHPGASAVVIRLSEIETDPLQGGGVRFDRHVRVDQRPATDTVCRRDVRFVEAAIGVETITIPARTDRCDQIEQTVEVIGARPEVEKMLCFGSSLAVQLGRAHRLEPLAHRRVLRWPRQPHRRHPPGAPLDHEHLLALVNQLRRRNRAPETRTDHDCVEVQRLVASSAEASADPLRRAMRTLCRGRLYDGCRPGCNLGILCPRAVPDDLRAGNCEDSFEISERLGRAWRPRRAVGSPETTFGFSG